MGAEYHKRLTLDGQGKLGSCAFAVDVLIENLLIYFHIKGEQLGWVSAVDFYRYLAFCWGGVGEGFDASR